jgi:hypothetical protein
MLMILMLKYTLCVPRSGTCSAPDIKAGACKDVFYTFEPCR